MHRLVRLSPLLVILCALLAVACGPSNHGFPGQPGEYAIQGHSVAFDGKEYSFAWSGADGTIHQAKGPTSSSSRTSAPSCRSDKAPPSCT